MDEKELCPLCGEGHVSAQMDVIETEYKGHVIQLPQHFKLCDHCGSDFAGAAEAKLNKRTLMAWRKQIDGLLTGAEIAALRAHYNLTQALAARLFGGGPVAFSKYENDDVAQSEAMDTLLRLVRRSEEAFRAVVEEKGLSAEFMHPDTSKHMERPATVLTVVRRNDEPSPHYDPKSFRSFRSPGEVQWKR
jgi:HTH-type transcriptional regulator/antitoxin MqsA